MGTHSLTDPLATPLLQNATTIASKFRDLYGLELALKQELRELGRVQVGAALFTRKRALSTYQRQSLRQRVMVACCCQGHLPRAVLWLQAGPASNPHVTT